MECPKCFGEMGTALNEKMKVEQCQNCHGLYFDQLTQELLPGLFGKEAIDSGSDEVGSTYDELVYVDCPKCDKIMDQRKLEAPLSIRFECCPTCNATFMDAGELRQYLSAEYLEAFKSLLPRK
ncbi:zf-TFIIB domain-containing protein [Gammaproteobacteria bacterium]|nr:zf-TFIIB domain-containing protein [Gammaproteobacteria bacterium]